MAWTLRKATPKDLPTLVRHRDAMWVEMGRVKAGEHDPTSEAYGKWLLARMKRGTLTAFVIQDDGEGGRRAPALASGAVWIQDVQPRPGHPLTMWGYILSVYTEPHARRRGLARAIVDACIQHAREAGCTRCCLHASAEGRPLYTQLGFEATEEMWLDLRPHHQRPKARKAQAKATVPTGRGRLGRQERMSAGTGGSRPGARKPS